jgi:alkanesulfonate monooxygenase SsuD/methylene tetrahydromethanopterin reductase-like flavin-dependent oxidoreductase (luciferase family)
MRHAIELGLDTFGDVTDGSDGQPLHQAQVIRNLVDEGVLADEVGVGWPPLSRDHFEQEIEHGSLYVGSPETVARKIAATAKALALARFDMKYSAGPLSHDKMMRSIELYGRKVVPLVRDMLT